MSLTNEDLKKFDDLLDKRISSAEDKLTKVIDDKVDFLARITKKEFDIVHSEIDSVKVDIADHDFKVTEQRVRRLEEKAGIGREK